MENIGVFSIGFLVLNIIVSQIFITGFEFIGLKFAGIQLDYSNWWSTIGSIAVRLSLNLPTAILLYFSSKYFGRNNILKEEYEYKMVAASTIEGYVIMNSNNNLNRINEEFTLKNLNQIFSFPRKNINDYKHSDDELMSLKPMEKLLDRTKPIFEKVESILNTSK